MALTKEAKNAAVEKVANLLADSKLTVAAKYSGTPVKQMQALRSDAKEHGTSVIVVKNRLFKKALENAGLNEVSAEIPLTGQLMYVFSRDETSAAQVVAAFAKANPQVEFVSGINSQGAIVPLEDLTMLANLPSKDQLRAQLVGTISAPISSFASVLAGLNRSVLNALNARAEQI